VPNGRYLLRLHFAEYNKTAAGQRLFDIETEGSIRVSNYDIFAQAGGRYRGVVAEFAVEVSDGILNLDLLNRLDSARISGIEIISATP
jgi:hypothetical protein